MKRDIFFNIILSAGCICLLWATHVFQKTQKHTLDQAVRENTLLKRECQILKRDHVFLESSSKEREMLRKKGWFSPLNRLIADEFLQSLRPRFRKMSYQFEPEILKTIEDIAFKVTRVSLETESFLDLELYEFIDTLSTEFPGILLPREITLTRQKDTPLFISGTFVFDWVSLRGREE